MIAIVLFTIAQLACSMCFVPAVRNKLDPEMIDDVEGFLYDVPEYDDPLVMQHQLSSIGAMPIFTLLESAKKRGNSKMDVLSEKINIEESKKVLDDVMSRIELAKAKLEKGNVNIYTDVEKVIQSLKALERSARPDMRRVLNSLQSIMSMARPFTMPEIKELISTSFSESDIKSSDVEKPNNFDRQSLRIRVMADGKPELEEKPELQNVSDLEQRLNFGKSLEEEKISEERSKSSESLEISKESREATKPPFEFKMKEKKDTNFDGEDGTSSYKAKLIWKAGGVN